jgi:hypothetical protein
MESAVDLYVADMAQRGIQDPSKARRMLTRLRDYANGREVILLKDLNARLLTEWRIRTACTVATQRNTNTLLNCCNISISLIDPDSQFSMSEIAWFRQQTPRLQRKHLLCSEPQAMLQADPLLGKLPCRPSLYLSTVTCAQPSTPGG